MKKSAVLAKLAKEIGQEKDKEPKNINLINGIITKYQAVKESICRLMSELLTTSNKFNTSLELMGESAFIGEAAAKVVEDHMVKPEDIHNKYKTEVEALITALEREVSITREDKVVARVDSRGSSRNSSPVSNKNHGKFIYISNMDPDHLEEAVFLKEVS